MMQFKKVPRVRIWAGAWLTVIVALGAWNSAEAGGYEFPGDGTRAIGRGGAFAARADDPMAIVVNPAGLASLPGTQFMISGHLLFAKNCFDRNLPGATSTGEPTPTTYDPRWGLDANGNPIEYDEVCNAKGHRFTGIPAIAVSWRVGPKVGMGFGFIPPNSERSGRYGDQNYDIPIRGTTQTSRFAGYVPAPSGSQPGPGLFDRRLVPLDQGEQLLPAPTRFMLVERNVLLIYPTFSVGAKPFHWLQVGGGFGWGIANVEVRNNVRNILPGESPSGTEGQVHIDQAWDWFAPRLLASVHFIPHDNLDIVGVFRWDDSVRAKGNISSDVPFLDDVAQGPNPLVGTSTIVAPRPWWITAGIRYAKRIVPRPSDPDAASRERNEVEDPMSTERWDLEINVVFEKNSLVRDFQIINQDVNTPNNTLPRPINATFLLGHNWQNQISLRVGSDYNIKPGVVAIRGGFSFDSNGWEGILSQTSKSGTIDFWPGQRFGFHVGATGRMGATKRAELSAAFTYYYMTPHSNANGGQEQVVIEPGAGGSQAPGFTTNNGRYTSRYIVASLMFRYFFRGRQGQ